MVSVICCPIKIKGICLKPLYSHALPCLIQLPGNGEQYHCVKSISQSINVFFTPLYGQMPQISSVLPCYLQLQSQRDVYNEGTELRRREMITQTSSQIRSQTVLFEIDRRYIPGCTALRIKSKQVQRDLKIIHIFRSM